jgi:hypothetical protein
MPEHRMTDGRFAELARHGDVLRVIEILVPKENDLPLQESVPHHFQLLRRQRLGEVNAFDLCTDMESQGNDFGGFQCIRSDRLTRRDHLPFSAIV